MKKTLNVGLIGSGRLGSKYADGGQARDLSTTIGRLLWALAAHGNAIYSGIFYTNAGGESRRRKLAPVSPETTRMALVPIIWPLSQSM